jgi:phospholipase C
MWRGFKALVTTLRHEDKNPTRALDGWLLVAMEDIQPCTRDELIELRDLRMGPKGSGPQLGTHHLRIWVHDTEGRKMVASESVGPEGRMKWSVTDAGKKRRKTLQGPLTRLGALVAFIVRSPSVWAGAIERLEEADDVGIAPPPPGRPRSPRITRSPGDEPSAADQARENLKRIKHIVVLMMENRSFDHMLGYLQLLDGQEEVTGPRDARPIMYDNEERRPVYLSKTAFPKSMDPPHGKKAIRDQINGGAMDGFIESFAEENDMPVPWRVMGYYTHLELPVYDYFAQNFLICDHWFSSVPSATWPNRLYSLVGTCDVDREGLFGEGQVLYDMPSFVRLLKNNDDPDTWRWYSWDPGTLRMIDGNYALDVGHGFHHHHFRRVTQHSMEPRADPDDPHVESVIRLGSGFLQDAANGDLPSVAWIDPNFVDLSILESNSNDDHPPSDVRSGQEMVMMVFRALAESPCWKDTMLVITYDEHGGFYDHLAPGTPPEANPQFETYGVRVPAFVVSPLVEPRTVSHTVFDHTSLIRTILERFGVPGAVEKMAETGPRVARAENLGRLLTRDPGENVGAPDYREVNARLNEWREFRAERRSAASPEIAKDRSGRPWEPTPITGFPAEFLDAARKLRKEGLPAGHP